MRCELRVNKLPSCFASPEVGGAYRYRDPPLHPCSSLARGIEGTRFLYSPDSRLKG